MLRRILVLAFFIGVLIPMFSQTPFKCIRVANPTTAFGVNLSIGDQVFCVSTNLSYTVSSATASTSTLTVSAANFNLMGGASDFDINIESNNSSVDASVFIVDFQSPLRVQSDGSSEVDISFDYTYPASQMLSGSKTNSFSHDVSSGSMGAYTAGGGVVILSLYQLSLGSSGTVFMNFSAAPETFTVNGYTDSGITGVTEVILGSVAIPTAGKHFSVTYTYISNGTTNQCYIIFGQEK